MLGKKSWNVYNPEAIARVRRDEAEARAREAEEEKRSREDDAADRLAQLRGTKGAKSLDEQRPPAVERSQKRRRLSGEDDKDRDSTLAVQPRVDAVSEMIAQDLRPARGKEKSHKQTDTSDALGVSLADALGRNTRSAKPWYSSTTADGGYDHENVSKDVWGNEDPGRLQREKQRVDANDPLAAIKKGVKQLRAAETQRKIWMDQREKDLYEVEDLARKERKRRRGPADTDDDSVEGFDLDQGYRKKDRDREPSRTSEPRYPRPHHHHHRHHHKRQRRDRSRSPRRGGE